MGSIIPRMGRALAKPIILPGARTLRFEAIARTAGYEDESSFRKAFRKLTLMSPQAYRARRMERVA